VVAAVTCLGMLVGMFAAHGTQGPPGTVQGQRLGKLIGFGLLLPVGLLWALVGVSSVKELSARLGPGSKPVTGRGAIPIGMLHAAFGGFLSGLCLYYVVSALLHG
jgi:hypothetical protein